ncbi:MAG TPA: hypothetical protein VMX97_02895 [Hyphomicrobiaceae bacterium]|nr:hypothetical protein [Hyphomicrobiaceae bacterium]
MSKGNTFETDFLALIFNAAAIANIADDAGTGPLTDLYVSLHTADPGETGTQDVSETAYTGYARVAVARTAGGWTVSSPGGVGTVNPVANIDFGECSALPGAAITHFAVGVAASGATKLLYSGTVTPNITMAVGVIPRLKTTSTITED